MQWRRHHGPSPRRKKRPAHLPCSSPPTLPLPMWRLHRNLWGLMLWTRAYPSQPTMSQNMRCITFFPLGSCPHPPLSSTRVSHLLALAIPDTLRLPPALSAFLTFAVPTGRVSLLCISYAKVRICTRHFPCHSAAEEGQSASYCSCCCFTFVQCQMCARLFAEHK